MILCIKQIQEVGRKLGGASVGSAFGAWKCWICLIFWKSWKIWNVGSWLVFKMILVLGCGMFWGGILCEVTLKAGVW